MKKTIISIIITLLVAHPTFSQNETIQQISFEFVSKYDARNNIAIAIDELENLYISSENELLKIDTNKTILFRQSIKQIGDIKQIALINKMKLMLFSNSQQTISFCDNTLSILQEEIDLSEEGFYDVTQIAPSSQVDKYWVYDQNNSKLALISNNKQQNQMIGNVCGLINCSKIIQLFEYNSNLYLIDEKKGIFQFDLYGSLLKRWHNTDIKHVIIDKNYAYILTEEKMILLNLLTLTEKDISIPKLKIIDFVKNESNFYFRTVDSVYKYRLILND